MVLGKLFRRRDEEHMSPRKLAFEASETQSVVNTLGQHLIDAYWGKYFMVLADPSRKSFHILRDPTASMPRFRAQCSRINIYFSEIDDCRLVSQLDFWVKSCVAGTIDYRDARRLAVEGCWRDRVTPKVGP